MLASSQIDMTTHQTVSLRNLQTEFATVRKQYFSRWDKAQRWTCRFLRRRRSATDCVGLCDPERRVIYAPADADSDLTLVLIHEICHAVTPQVNHGLPWQTRMLKAATMVGRSGRLRLAQLLRQEVERYRRDAELVTSKVIYCEIEECLWDLPKVPSFRSVVKLVAKRNSMTVQGLLKRFPRAKRVYDKAIRVLV